MLGGYSEVTASLKEVMAVYLPPCKWLRSPAVECPETEISSTHTPEAHSRVWNLPLPLPAVHKLIQLVAVMWLCCVLSASFRIISGPVNSLFLCHTVKYELQQCIKSLVCCLWHRVAFELTERWTTDATVVWCRLIWYSVQPAAFVTNTTIALVSDSESVLTGMV